MIYIPIFTAVVAGLLGLFIGRLNVKSEEKKQERKRLRRLLYNMLELKNWVDKVISAETLSGKYVERMTAAIASRYPEMQNDEVNKVETMISSGLKKMVINQPQTVRLEQNINDIIRDFSEIDPFFAYDLTGKYQLNEILEQIKFSINDLVPEEESVSQASAFLDRLLRPVMMAELQHDLNIHLPIIAKLIDKNTTATIRSKFIHGSTANSEEDLERYCNEMLPCLFTTIDQLLGLKTFEEHEAH
ncbi:hypothetical protein IDJ75_11105 [Mucilaginibacter rigui]|uniref:Uncharacterized protein n=1 Tax=Mucilaginibacter rigui TaxID=534635 RepID=A0ABR7X5H5_9SPHI|nr:hypothetical protein [Mucilaginibacter rigui]MBD1385828.1 hypothetical protein [Mucilaginibacter rigui]